MNNDKFEEIFESIISRISNTLLVKAKEYVRNGDRLHNFNTGAEITGNSREKVLDGFMLKHYISYRDMINDIEQGNLPTIPHLEEKVGDLLAYFIIFEASVKEKIEKENELRTRVVEETRPI